MNFCGNFDQKWTRLTRETKKTEVKIFQKFLFLSESTFVDKFYIGGVTATVAQEIGYKLTCKKNNELVGWQNFLFLFCFIYLFF